MDNAQRARDDLGRRVREVWIAWAREQPNPKPHWLTPWDDLAEPDKEVDRRIGETIAAEAHARAIEQAAGVCRERSDRYVDAAIDLEKLGHAETGEEVRCEARMARECESAIRALSPEGWVGVRREDLAALLGAVDRVVTACDGISWDTEPRELTSAIGALGDASLAPAIRAALAEVDRG